ncbi:Lymphocyte antigen 6E [Varanus komodoensis]|uniref:lymphocyte antigen 6E-like n=1 Tax=Varanus komodoensis TaxID=61221 RepID=UPI001CF79B75|nr:lymphocyte antigen 6E-like [Varanus komodoensis]KAF7237209.1 Lymphocyte antigen 6E [Varanus komodoensis]
MRPYFVALLCVMLLDPDQVHALVCFTCERRASNWDCLKTVAKCSENDKYCVTSVASLAVGLLTLGKRITKQCSPTCPEWDMHLGMASYTTSCCQSFLCNFWGRVSQR